jgi:hypothetical protein
LATPPHRHAIPDVTARRRRYCFTQTDLAAHLAASHGGYTPIDAAPNKASLAIQVAQRRALVLRRNDAALVPCRKALLYRKAWSGPERSLVYSLVDNLSAPEKGPGFAGLYSCPVKGCDDMFDLMDERAHHLRSHRVELPVRTGAVSVVGMEMAGAFRSHTGLSLALH